MNTAPQTQQHNGDLSGAAWYRRPDFWFWLIAACGLLFRLEYLREFSLLPHFDMAIGPDVQDYYDRAQEILSGKIFPASPDIHAPLYSTFLAALLRLTGNSVAWVRAIQLLLNYAAWLWLCRILRNAGANMRVILIFLSLAMFTPVLLFHQSELISESLLIPLLAGAIYFLYNADSNKNPDRQHFSAGLCCGLAILTHGFMWAFAAAEAGYHLYMRQWKAAAMILCGVAVMTVPVILAKSIYYERFTTLQQNSAFNIWLGNNPAADGGCYLRPGSAWESEHRTAEAEAAARKISIDRLYWERMGKFYLSTPGALLRLPLKKLWKLLLPVEFISGADSPAMIYKTPLQYYLRGVAVIPSILVLAGIVMLIYKRGEKKYIHFYLLPAALALAQILTVTSGRYRVPLMPGALLLAAATAATLNKKQLFTGTVAALALAVFSLPTPPRLDPEERSIMGEVYFRQGKFDLADPALEFASRHIDDPTRFANMRGIIAEKRGNISLAKSFYLQARSPYNPQGHFNCGLLLSNDTSVNDLLLANAMLVEGLKITPDRPDIWNQIGINFVKLNNLKLAEAAFARAVELSPAHPGYRKNLNFTRSR
ncbi:MAG: glycosyltransferase family 39 protein [Lentisphaeria bacterium]|nr:glycosyltransferase family 39 protein [Lentisphaeria bacterium]